jgi:hypothetical protein
MVICPSLTNEKIDFYSRNTQIDFWDIKSQLLGYHKLISVTEIKKC